MTTLEDLAKTYGFPFKAIPVDKSWWMQHHSHVKEFTFTGLDLEDDTYFICPSNEASGTMAKTGLFWTIVETPETLIRMLDKGRKPPFTVKWFDNKLVEVIEYNEETAEFTIYELDFPEHHYQVFKPNSLMFYYVPGEEK